MPLLFTDVLRVREQVLLKRSQIADGMHHGSGVLIRNILRQFREGTGTKYNCSSYSYIFRATPTYLSAPRSALYSYFATA